MAPKCSFRKCGDDPTVGKHRLFHFPHERTRCIHWIANAQRPEFLHLPPESLRNRSICAIHFEEKYFMNSFKVRLTHNAVPTLYQGTDVSVSQEVLQEYLKPKDREILNSKIEIKIEANDPNLSLMNVDGGTFRICELPPPPVEADVVLDIPLVLPPKRRAPPQKRKIKKTRQERPEFSNPPQDPLHDPLEIVQDDNNLTFMVTEDGDLNLCPTSNSSYTSLTHNNIKLEPKLDEEGAITYSICVDEEPQSYHNKVREITNTSSDLVVTKNRRTVPEPQTEFEQLLAIVDTELKEATNSEVMSKRLQAKNHVLYKHLSKNINPMLASLLKMELFGRSSARQAAINLYTSSPQGYNVLMEHWGLRLPPINVVKEWINK